MKKIFPLLLLFFVFTNIFGQDLIKIRSSNSRFGVVIGINRFVDYDSNRNYSDQEVVAGMNFHLGLVLNFPISKKFYFQPELVFQIIGQTRKVIEQNFSFTFYQEERYSANYLQIPLNFKYLFSNKINLDFGPNVGFLIANKYVYYNVYELIMGDKSGSISEKINDGNLIIFGFNLGLNYNINNNIYVGARNTFLVGNYSKFSDTFKNSILGFNLGYLL